MRQPDERGARARLLLLSERGGACTVAAEATAAETVERWRSQLGPPGLAQLQAALTTITTPLTIAAIVVILSPKRIDHRST
jgi:hypothetical protein